jgi:AraC-like DNA-binding protein
MNRNNLPIAPDLTKTTERFTATIPKFNKNGSYARARMRGVILSPIGWQRFQAAKQQAELEEIWGKHFTQENLSARTALSINTLSRIFKREQGVDRQSLEYLFQAFGLELTTADFTSCPVD